jgi:hypothetical protein
MHQTEVRKIMAAEYSVAKGFWMHIKILWATQRQMHAYLKIILTVKLPQNVCRKIQQIRLINKEHFLRG